MKQTAVEWLVIALDALDEQMKVAPKTTNYKSTRESIIKQAEEMEKEQMCDFADYVINRAKEFEDGEIDHREYEGSIDEMFERRYREEGTKLSPKEERFWKEVDKLRKEREEKKSFNTKEI